MDSTLVYTGEDHSNWFYDRYFYNGSNSRYYTFQLSLNLLHQRHELPVILETGCQRHEEDVGAGMSTSIFAEYIKRYGGSLITVDNNEEHLERVRGFLEKWPDIDKTFVKSDSIQYLKEYKGKCDLLYLDSLDYPVGVDLGNRQMQIAAQDHCLNEFLAVEDQLSSNSIVLLDDNQFAGGGKPALAKRYLLQMGWTCLLDLQSSLWVKEL